MGAFAGQSDVGEWSERLRQASALRVDLRWRGFCQRRLAHPQLITCEILNSLEERHKFLSGRGVHWAGIVGDKFIKKGGDGAMG